MSHVLIGTFTCVLDSLPVQGLVHVKALAGLLGFASDRRKPVELVASFRTQVEWANGGGCFHFTLLARLHGAGVRFASATAAETVAPERARKQKGMAKGSRSIFPSREEGRFAEAGFLISRPLRRCQREVATLPPPDQARKCRDVV